MLLAEMEVRHSRPVVPTRRVALGRMDLPVEPAPGFGGLLLAGLVAAHTFALDEDLAAELDGLLDHLEAGRRIPQPRLRHRFQTDVVGLDRSRHRLFGSGEELQFDIDDRGAPLPQILGACYAASRLPPRARPTVFGLLRRATRWCGERGEAGAPLVAFLAGDVASSSRRRAVLGDERWALTVLGFGARTRPDAPSVQRRFRTLVRVAHPDQGGRNEGAGQRILDLTEARRILLAQ